MTTHGHKRSTNDDAVGYRLLALEGESGCVFCRVHGRELKSTLPSASSHGTWECATRSLLRMWNLRAIRGGGSSRETAMVGPGDYYCNVEQPHRYAFTVQGGIGGVPTFVPHDRQTALDPAAVAVQDPSRRRAVDPSTDVAVVRATWFSGTANKDDVDRLLKSAYLQQRHPDGHTPSSPLGASLFPNAGLLEVDLSSTQHSAVAVETVDDRIDRGGPANTTLPHVDATTIDLRPFRARLVRNDVPFIITDVALKAKDEFRPVSYDFGQRYTEYCVAEAGGLFLEHHDFTQTMTPLDATAQGFIVLGRWRDSDITTPTNAKKPRSGLLELIAVHVPLGWTLVVEAGCIHGDSTFRGLYMMAMTSNHVVMNTADTVFLKCAATKRNVMMSVPAPTPVGPSITDVASTMAWTPPPKPVVLFKNASHAELVEFKSATKHESFMVQPFSKISWTSTMFRRFGWYPGVPKPEGETIDQPRAAVLTETAPA